MANNFILTNAQLEYISKKASQTELIIQSVKKVNGDWCLFLTASDGTQIVEYAKRESNE